MSFSKTDIIDELVDQIGETLLPGKEKQEYRVIDEVIIVEAEKEHDGILQAQTIERILADTLMNFSSRVKDVLLFDKGISLAWGIEERQLQDYVQFRLTEIRFILDGVN